MSVNIDDVIERIKKESDIFSKARLISYLRREKGVKVMEIAKKLNIKSSYVCHINRLNKLPDIIIDAYYSKSITISHLFLLSRIDDKGKMVDVYEQILTHALSVKATEDKIREYLYQIKDKGSFIRDKERQKITSTVKEKHPEVEIMILQTRTKSKILLEIKGNLEKTSRKVKELMELLGK